MIQSRDELITEMAEEYGLNRMRENNDDEDDDDGGDATAPPASTSPATVAEEIVEEEALMEMVPEQDAPVAHEVLLADAEPKPP
jgi:hypothetical protein